MENIDLIYRKKDSLSAFDSGGDLLEPKLKKKIRLTILSAHFGLLALMVLWYLIANFFIAKKPQIIQVTLVTPEAATAITPTPTAPTPTPARPTPPAVKPKPKPKTQPKPKPTPKPKPVWKPRSVDDIKISKKVIKNNPVQTPPTVSATDIERNLKNSFLKNRVTTTNTQGTATNNKVQQNYFEKISALMYQSWQQPGQSELHGKYPVVDVEITVDGSGRIVNSRLQRKSGIPVMDQSAEKLLRELRNLPPPPNGKTTFTVSLEIIND